MCPTLFFQAYQVLVHCRLPSNSSSELKCSGTRLLGPIWLEFSLWRSISLVDIYWWQGTNFYFLFFFVPHFQNQWQWAAPAVLRLLLLLLLLLFFIFHDRHPVICTLHDPTKPTQGGSQTRRRDLEKLYVRSFFTDVVVCCCEIRLEHVFLVCSFFTLFLIYGT